MRNPRAGKYRHQIDHGKGPPCGGGYSPQFPQTIEYSRSFRPQTVDATMTEMTILANNGKLFERRCCRTIRLLPNDTGPSELIEVSVDFFIGSTTAGKLRLEFHTLNDVIKDTYTESSHSPSHFIRTVAHDIPLRRAKWVDKDERVVVELPKCWFEFWISGIRAVSTFSKELVNLNLPSTVDEWQWNMLSFKTEWNLPLPLSSLLLIAEIGFSGSELILMNHTRSGPSRFWRRSGPCSFNFRFSFTKAQTYIIDR